MADISKEIKAWQEAVYGEDVRKAQVDLSNKLNTEVEKATKTVGDYTAAETGRVNAEKARVAAETKRQTDTDKAIGNAETATANATTIYEQIKDTDVGDLTLRVGGLETEVNKLKIYRSFTELGLGANPTVAQVVNAMKDGSVLMMHQDAGRSIVGSPNIYTLLTVKRMNTARTTLELMGEGGSWYMAGSTTQLATANWRRVAEGNTLQIATFEASLANMNAGTSYQVSIPVTGLNGKTILSANAYLRGGSPVAMSINTMSTSAITIYAKSDVALTNRTFRADVFYV